MMMRPVFAFLLAFCCAGLAPEATAHPVAQGAIEVTIQPGAIVIEAHVSNEEAYVAEAYGGNPPSANAEEIRRRHGDYLLAHLRVEAGGGVLIGRLDAVGPPDSPAPESFIHYRLTYPLPAGDADASRVLTLRQNVLNEFVFAPGNPWEAAYIVRIIEDDRPRKEGLLFTRRDALEYRANDPSALSAGTAPLQTSVMARAFIKSGIEHILGGYDHLLFVASLVLGAVTLLDMLKAVLVFTLAHSITLTLAALDIVRVPARIVEPMVAASIIIVAVQNVLTPRQHQTRGRLSVAFGFGLFHGLGYAGGLLGAMHG